MSVSSFVSRLPALLQKHALRALYLKNGLYLQDVVRFNQGEFFAFKVRNRYVPAQGVSWYLDFHAYLRQFRDIAGWGYLPQPGDVVVDIGAGIGEEAVVMSELVGPLGRVIAIEANPEAFKVLESIIALNGLSNVDAYNVAIHIEDGPVEIAVPQNFASGTVGSTGKEDRTYTVRGVRLDSFLESAGVTSLAMLKSNIEGAERFVVASLGTYLHRISHFAIACHDFRYTRERVEFFQTKSLVHRYLEEGGMSPTSQQTGIPYIDDWVYASARA